MQCLVHVHNNTGRVSQGQQLILPNLFVSNLLNRPATVAVINPLQSIDFFQTIHFS